MRLKLFIISALKSIFSFILNACVHVHNHATLAQNMQICSCECSALGGQKRASDFPQGEVIGDCEPLDMGAGH